MIKYNNSNINDWNYGDDNIVKVYRNGATVYYKVITSGGTPEYKVCYAVVDDITQYSDTEFVDVYDKKTEKWYKLNNLNQYEKYGVYGDSIATSGTSRLPQGYTEVEYIRNNNYNAYINTGVIPYDNTTNTYTITTKLTSEFHSDLGCATIISAEVPVSPYHGLGYRYKCSSTVNQLEFFGYMGAYSSSTVDNDDGTKTITFQSSGNTSWTSSTPLSYFCSFNSTSYDSNSAYRFSDASIYSATVVKNGSTVRDFVPAKRNIDSVYGLYDLINDAFYTSPNGNNFSGGSAVTPTAATYYEGKLAIVDGYEYQYSGNSWVNVGEVSGSSRLPQGYTEVEYIQNTGHSYIDTNFVPNQDTRIVADMQLVTLTNYPRLFGAGGWNAADGINIDYEGGHLLFSWFGKTSWTQTTLATNYNRHIYDLNKNILYVDGTSLTSSSYITKTASDHLAFFTYIRNGRPSDTTNWNKEFFKGKLWSFQVYDNGTLVRDFVPCIRDNDSKVGAYDIVNDVFYTVPTGYTTDQLVAGSATIHVVYPLYYDEKTDPLNNLTFETMEDAQDYAYNNCVYDGMRATIGGDRYYFDSEDENGWVKILSYYKVEDVTPNAASGWTITSSSTYNPDSSYYDDFSVETTSTSYSYKIAKVTIYGYDHFTYYLRAKNNYNYTNAYAMASNIDELQSDPTSMSYNDSRAITNTYGKYMTEGASVDLNNYRRVTYNNLDKTVEHTFYVVFYGRTYSGYKGNATILIPKEQTNENWEQVTFSASSNVASAQKNLYIDGNNSTSGGTNYWYYRWIVGLPSGSHSSYTNYTSYNYCPSTTSSTFTSVVGEQRQVNFTYNNTSDKNLQFRLVDESGNTISTSSTVYYNMVLYNSCGVTSNNSNLTFPRSQSVKVGGSFQFSNSSNRHYIYGYTPNIRFSTSYYSDNYNTYFDIPYTKLNTEAVTITYTTYDPNDTEVPAFKTDITYPYNGGTTSSTTLTSYEVPYTYSYVVKQTNGLFYTSNQSFTASQTSRTISFTLYPNKREFSTVADLEAYQYAWEGMIAFVDGTTYEYKNGEWNINPYIVPTGYTELEYCTVPRVKPSTFFTVPYECQPNYIYTTEFTPINFWTTSYYGGIAGYTNGSDDFEYLLFKLDNGWGDQWHRSCLKFQNYAWDTRSGSNGTVPGAFTFYENVKAKIIFHLNGYTAGQGGVITIENEGYSTYTNTRTQVINSSWQPTYGVKDLKLFSTNSSSDYCANMKFHNFKIEDNDGNLIYNYKPVTRLSDSKVGVYDVVNQEFYFPTGFTLTAGPSV